MQIQMQQKQREEQREEQIQGEGLREEGMEGMGWREKELCEIQGKLYTVDFEIGEGTQATVENVVDEKGKKYALKTIKRQYFRYSDVRNMIRSEVQIQKQFAHSPNVINIIASEYKYQDFRQDQQTMKIVLELGECSLRNWIDSKNSLWQNQFIYMMCSICTGIAQIHEKNVIHRDIKPQNIIKVGNVFKITDFGASCQTKSGQGSKNIKGTLLYLSPQMIYNNGINFTNKADIWSLGVTMFQVYFKVHPFFYLPYENQYEEKQIFEELKKNIDKLTPNFTIQKFLTHLQKQNVPQRYNFILQKQKNTSKQLLQNLCLLLQKDPQQRLDINLCRQKFNTLKQKKDILSQKIKTYQIPTDTPAQIHLFASTSNMCQQLQSLYHLDTAQRVRYAVQLAVKCIQHWDYGGKQFIPLDEEVLKYDKRDVFLKKQVRDVLKAYYKSLKREESNLHEFQKFNQLKIQALFCFLWFVLEKEEEIVEQVKIIIGQKYQDIKKVTDIFIYLHALSDKQILNIELFMKKRYEMFF